MQLDNRPDVTDAWAVYADGRKEPLIQKLHRDGDLSQCTFLGEINDGGYRIVLRVDWDQKDSKGNPILDANIFHNRKEYKTDWTKWHNTSKTFDSGEWVYKFEFGSVKIRFKLGFTSEKHIESKASIKVPSKPILETPVGEEEIYCAQCRALKTHQLSVDHNAETVARCGCGRFLKFARTDSDAELEKLIAAHNAANQS
jgi:hypothetical protein